ncbi:MAG: 23S rRNA (uracil(1939)-C(5))-methyltransferase RlmD, partial [Clostridia bacterium]|nr:23S rRNA (uracil(1939)-C(5))-methyltransferase RlmD [Clostridia bacterium]
MKCPLSEKGCGGCQGIDEAYGELLKRKSDRFRRLFPDALPALGMEDPRFYRNKVLRTFANGKSGLYHGLYRTGTHQVISVRRCLLENEQAAHIAQTALDLLSGMGLRAYREDFGSGVLRHLLIRRGYHSGQALVTVITGSEKFEGGREFALRLMQLCPEVKGVIHNINPRGDSAVMGYRSRILAGRDGIWDTMNGLRVFLNSRSFYQVNTVQAEKLYARAIEFAGLSPSDTVLDAYCGIGILGMLAARKAGQVTGIEIVPDAVDCAQKTAQFNHIGNIRFLKGDTAEILNKTELLPSVVFMDPPRAGCSAAFLSAILGYAPSRIVYISCNPETLRRDTDLLIRGGYRMEKVQPVDLFPYTEHVETV